jgi:hypothetical protein
MPLPNYQSVTIIYILKELSSKSWELTVGRCSGFFLNMLLIRPFLQQPTLDQYEHTAACEQQQPCRLENQSQSTVSILGIALS